MTAPTSAKVTVLPTPRTYAEMNRDLHALLQNAPIKGPYVLVGFSMGGNLVRLYTGQYPEDVVGVVLVNSFHPDAGPRLAAILHPEMPGEDEKTSTLGVNMPYRHDFSRGIQNLILKMLIIWSVWNRSER